MRHGLERWLGVVVLSLDVMGVPISSREGRTSLEHAKGVVRHMGDPCPKTCHVDPRGLLVEGVRMRWLAIGVLIAGSLAVGLLAHSIPTAAAGGKTAVTSYNDGWIDAKTDDCQQGDPLACQWLHAQK